MNTDRPNYEELYKLAYRKHHELLNEIEDALKEHDRDFGATKSDTIGAIRMIHEKYTTGDFK